MRISTSKSEVMVLSWKRVECRVGEELLPQVDKFKYLGVLFMSEGRMGLKRNGAASAAMWTSAVVTKRDEP